MSGKPRISRATVLLAVGVLASIAAVATAAGWLAYRDQAATLERQTHGSLVAIADLKAGEISEWIAERRGDAETLQDNPAVAAGLEGWFADIDRDPFFDDVVPLLTTTRQVYGYTDITVLDADDAVRYSVPPETTPLGTAEIGAIAAARQADATEVSDPFIDAAGRLSMVAAVPIRALDGDRPVGCLLLRMDAERTLAPTMARWTLPSDTGETLLVMRDGDEVVFLNRLRHRDDAAPTFRLPLSSPSLPAAVALRGEAGVWSGTDYRGVPVIFASRPVDGTSWHVIAKVDRDEVTAPARTRGLVTAGLTGVGIAVVVAASLLWWQLREAQAVRDAYEERDRAERSQQETENRFRSLFETMTEGLAVGRLVPAAGEPTDFEVAEQNDAFQQHTGLPSRDTVGKGIGGLLGPAAPLFLHRLTDAARSGEPRSFEMYLESSDRQLQVTAFCPLAGDDTLAVIVEDISERKRLEREILERTMRYELVLSGAAGAIWDWDVTGGTVYRSPSWRLQRGFAVDDVDAPEREWGTGMHPDDAPRVWALVEEHFAGRLPAFEAEYRVRRKDGSWMWVADRGMAQRDETGTVVRMAGSEIDITDRKRAELTLIDNERRAGLLAQTVGALLASDDPQALVERLCREVMEELGCEVFLNYLFDEESDRLHLNASAGVPAPIAERIEWMEVSAATSTCVFCDGWPIVGDGEESVAALSDHHAFGALGAWACRPLRARGRLFGTLSFGSSLRGRFDETELSLVAAVADHVAIAMDRRRTEAELRRSEQTQRELVTTLNLERLRLDATIEQMDVGVVTAAGDGTLLSMNARALELHGLADHEEMLPHLEDYAQYFELRYIDGRPMPVEEWPLARAVRGDFVRDFEVFVSNTRTGTRGVWSFSVTPVRSGLGQPFLMVLTIYDLSDRKSLEESLRTELDNTRVLLATATVMAESLDASELGSALTDLVHEVTDCERVQCVLWDHNTRTFELAAEYGASPSPGPTRWLFNDLPPTLQDAVSGRKARLLSLRDPATSPRTHPAAIDRLLFLPLVHRSRLIGYLTATDTGGPNSLTQRRLALLQSMTSLAAIAIENARLYEAQKDIAVTLQEQYIHPLPKIAGLELAVVAESHFSPELIGGDFHDVFELPHGLIAILLGDVEGKGIRAAGLAETVRSAVRALTMVSPSPRYVLNNVSRTLLQQGSEQFVTATLMILDPAGGVTLAANAGHPPAVHLTADGTSVIEAPVGPPLGTFAWDYAQSSFTLRAGDTLVVCTDGVVEARRGDDFFGIEGVRATLRQMGDAEPATIAERIRDEAVSFAGRLRDDLQLVVVRYVGRTATDEPATPSLTLTVPESPWRLIDIRGAARDFLDAHGVQELMTDDLLLCIEEACTNVMLHSQTSEPALVRLQIDDGVVEITVRDHGRGFPLDELHLDREPDPMAVSGRGLFLMKSIADAMELTNEGGACVRLRVQRRPAGDS